jgi:ABC-2 type transport system ATP-binding protein
VREPARAFCPGARAGTFILSVVTTPQAAWPESARSRAHSKCEVNMNLQTQPSTAIEARGLAKRFGDVEAVAGIDFDVREGELFGFLGPNGAGKSTTINILIGLARPDAGAIRIGGIDCSTNPKAAQRLMGVVPDESNLYPELTGFDNLSFCGSLYGMARRDRETRARELLKRFGLAEAGGRKFGGYSKGMKRKLTIAAGIIHSPAILFMDEPTTGIDVASARQIRQLIADLNTNGTTIFLTTHYIEEAERLCRCIAFIVKGRIVRTDTVDDLMRETKGRHVVQFSVDKGAAGLCEAMTSAFPRLQCRTVTSAEIRVESSEPIRVGPLVRFLEERGAEVAEARKLRPSLEDVFVDITGIKAGEMKQEREKAKKGGAA